VPELPEVEILVRHLAPRLRNRTIHAVRVLRARVLGATRLQRFRRVVQGTAFTGISRRGKYLLFNVRSQTKAESILLVGHLGMTGRMYLQPKGVSLPRHAAAVFDLGRENFVFEDTRTFGRLTLDTSSIARLGPEPLGNEFTAESFGRDLRRSAQAIKVKLLDQSLVAGIGNIYACEALFRARIPPELPARRLDSRQVKRLWRAIREVLVEAIELGGSIELAHSGEPAGDGLFYFGSAGETANSSPERFRVYDRLGQPCCRCGTAIERRIQAARSTYYCPRCQSAEQQPRGQIPFDATA